MTIIRSRRLWALMPGLLSTLLVASGMAGPVFAAVPQASAVDDSAVDTSGAVTVPAGLAPNPGAPRPYFPADVAQIPAGGSLPDLFTFFSATADPNGDGRVGNALEWAARSAELSDLMQYYLYGYQHPTPEDGSSFRQETVPPSTTVNFSAVFDSSAFTFRLPAGSFTFDFSTFTVFPNLSFVASAPYDAPEGFQDWDTGDTWNDADHRTLLMVVPATTRTVVDVSDPGATGRTTATFRLRGFEVPQQGADTDIPGPYPVVLVVGTLPTQQVTTLKRNGYAYIAMDTGSVYSDGGNNPHTGAYNQLYPYQAGIYTNDSGTLMGWAWGISRIVDAMKNDAEGSNRFNLAWGKTAVTGVSRNGKAAALAAAFDNRIAIAAPSDPGGGGLTGFRDLTEGQMFTYNVPNGFDQIYSRNETVQRAIGNPDESAWFSSKARGFVPDKAAHAPFDLHAVAALVAPRPFLLWTGEAQQSWLGSPSSVLSMQAAQEAYEFLGAGGNIGWIVRDAAHANQDRDLPDLIAVMDKTFGRRNTLTRRHFDTLVGSNGAARDGSGVIRPEANFDSVAAMTRNPFDINSSMVRWSRPGKYSLWSDDMFVTAGRARKLTFHTDAHQVYLTLPDGRRLMSAAPHGIATFTLDASQAQVGRYVAESKGNAKGHKTIELAGFSLSDALRHGLNLSSGVPNGMSIGFTSPLANYGSVDDPVQLYVNGNRITASIFDDSNNYKGYIERYGASLQLAGAPEGPWDGTVNFVFAAKNLKLDALPGFTFAVDVGVTKTRVPNFLGQLVNGFGSPLRETPSWSSQNLQNTPLAGNFNGRWPLFPNSINDDGSRPVSRPNQTGFHTQITVSGASVTGLTLRFSEPLDPREFGLGLDLVSSWTTEWASDHTSVNITYGQPMACRGDVHLILFRAMDTAANLIGGPQLFTVPGNTTGPKCRDDD
ncbi:MAG TPA: hypothetical protein VFC19_54135 [Candidatus Limnocylindrales bacterium]|nr:hypothetical protein [Candidatus Limnocylindrales bacterium]